MREETAIAMSSLDLTRTRPQPRLLRYAALWLGALVVGAIVAALTAGGSAGDPVLYAMLVVALTAAVAPFVLLKAVVGRRDGREPGL